MRKNKVMQKRKNLRIFLDIGIKHEDLYRI
jgi:hypothetical protein